MRVIAARPSPHPRTSGAVALVVLVGLLVTVGASWTAWRLDRSNERDLLRVQTKQAADVLGSAIVGIVNPLRTSVALAGETDGDAAAFERYFAPYVARGGLFVGASLWRVGASGATRVGDVGREVIQDPDSPAGRRFVARALRSPSFAAMGLFAATPQRVAYALAGPGPTRYVVYAERAIPANRRVPAEDDAAFADLHFATYLGSRLDATTLSTTNVDPAHLPLSGSTARVAIPFGDTRLTLVAQSAKHLGGQLAARLPWISGGVGLVLTLFAAFTTRQLVRRRRTAETDAETIKELYERLDALYARQRSVSLTLQHALLPRTNPTIPGVEFASAYVAGDSGVEIGGDWYSVIALPGGRFGFVVGDVSGRGLDAAVIMARARFTLRAYLLEGHGPDDALRMAANDLDVVVDGHLVTALVGVGDPATRTVTLANAGHLPPLLVAGDGVAFAATDAGPPLGVTRSSYPATTIEMPPGSLLLGFTDGLVERRNEDIDEGLGRLAAAAALPDGPLDGWLAALLPSLLGDGPASDDVAVLAVRWEGQAPRSPASVPATAAPPLPG